MNITEGKLKCFQAIFSLLDSDGDGILSQKVRSRWTLSDSTFPDPLFQFQDIDTKATSEKIAFFKSAMAKIEAAKDKQESFNFQDFLMVVSAKTREEKLR